MTNTTVFISAVSSELRAYRIALADMLRGAKINVVLQENLTYDGDTLLAVLENEIKTAQAAICLVGAGSGGAFPSVKEGAPYQDLLPPAQDRASHTQWEVILARHHGLRVLYYYPSETLAPTLPPLSAEDDPALQARFKDWLKAEGVPRLEFDDPKDLAIKVLQQLYPERSRADLASLLPPITHGIPPSLGARFVGRDDFLTQVRQTLTQSNTTAITAAVTGMGGVGKTRAAAEYAWAHQADYPGGMLMIPAATASSLQTNLAALTTPLSIPGMDAQPAETRVNAVINWLRGHRDWLLILDHVDTDDGMQAAYSLRGALPHGHVLLTSRQGTVPDGFHPLHLGVLSPAAATEFLLTATTGKRAPAADDDAQALGLAQDLGRLALALTHAAAYIARYRLTFAAYRAELAHTFEHVLGFKGQTVRDHEASALATLEVSLGRATPAGRALLERLAFLADAPVPMALLAVAVAGDDASQREAEADLSDYSLVTRDTVSGTFTTHRLVRELLRRRLSPQDARARLEQALRWVDAAFEGNPQDARTWPRLLPLAEHAEMVALAAEQAGIDAPTGRLMGALDMLFDARAQYGRAERMSRAALAIGERSLGPDHPNVATRLNNLAGLLRATNRLAEAEPLYRRALAIGEASVGPDHPTVATRLNNLAALLYATNRLAEAEPLYRRALAIDEASLGPDHPNVAIRLNNLAALLRATNRLAEAEPLFRRALAIDEASLGPDHPAVARDLNNLALLLQATNRLAEAEPLYHRALAIDQASLGPDHPNVATRLNNLAELLHATNRLAEAEPLSRRMVLIFLKFQRATGHAHPHRDTALNNYASILDALGRTQDEIIAERQALLAEAGLDGI